MAKHIRITQKALASKGPFSVITANGLLSVLIEKETELRDSAQKPGSVLPELLEQLRQFIVANADRFDEFEPRPPFRRE